jgi:hypothetical protein
MSRTTNSRASLGNAGGVSTTQEERASVGTQSTGAGQNRTHLIKQLVEVVKEKQDINKSILSENLSKSRSSVNA